MSTAPAASASRPNATAPADEVDVVVVGSGVAGLSVALGLARTSRVLVLSKGGPGDGSTSWAQGGIAAVVRAGDSPADHAHDTVVAGAGACDPEAVAVLVQEGPSGLADLLAAGARFDTDPDGRLSVTREGGHHADRVVHAGGDATGAEVSRALLAAVVAAGVEVRTGTRVLDVLTIGVGGRTAVTGVATVGADGVGRVVATPAVVLATGGIGHAYGTSTNPPGVTGDGLALALRAGAVLTDLEFVQFHPTALWTGPNGSGRLPLVSEAVRGAGATLVDGAGRAVMVGVHPLGDLAPRDIVARTIIERLAAAPGGIGDHVFLDTTRLGRETVHARFPTMVTACAAIGLDPVSEPVPVTPAEHFLCGGIATDGWGRTGVVGLSAVGEVAATGVHGANRLASNSLLEGLCSVAGLPPGCWWTRPRGTRRTHSPRRWAQPATPAVTVTPVMTVTPAVTVTPALTTVWGVGAARVRASTRRRSERCSPDTSGSGGTGRGWRLPRTCSPRRREWAPRTCTPSPGLSCSPRPHARRAGAVTGGPTTPHRM